VFVVLDGERLPAHHVRRAVLRGYHPHRHPRLGRPNHMVRIVLKTLRVRVQHVRHVGWLGHHEFDLPVKLWPASQGRWQAAHSKLHVVPAACLRA